MCKLLIGIFILFATNSFAQEWIEYQIDSTFTVAIPSDFVSIDTLGQRIIRAQIDNGLIMVSMVPNEGKNGVSINTKEQLLDFYKGLREGYIGSQHGELISEQTVERDSLILSRFSFRAATGDETHIRHCDAIILNDNIYVVNFWELESMTEQMSAMRNNFFASIRFAENLTIQNQMSNAGADAFAYNAGSLLGKILVYGLIAGLLVLLTTWLKRKKRAKSARHQWPTSP